MVYDKMNEYIESIYGVFKMIISKTDFKEKETKARYILLIILNYVIKLGKDYNVDLKSIEEKEAINLIPFFEYISYNNIELYDFNNVKIEDVDTTKKEDLERFVLSHIYYITQKNK